MLKVINPSTGEMVREYAVMSPDQMERAVGDALRIFNEWRLLELEARAQSLRRVAQVLRERVAELAELMALEMGKPVSQGEQEVEKCAWVCEHFADAAATYLAPEVVKTEASRSFVTCSPLGVILAIMPWNFPLWQFFRCAAPALMAGNAVLLKHSSNVPGCAAAIEDICRAGGLPGGLVRALYVDAAAVSHLVRDERIAAVTLTGSEAAGREIASAAGAALKKIVLELGGADPYVVLEDADLELAAKTCVASRLINSGQSCIAAKRFIVVASVLDDFQTKVVQLMRTVEVGPPMKTETIVGPIARRDLRDELHDQVRRSIDAGARCVLGGERPDSPGFFYPATVLTGVTPGMAVHDEETFGPVAAIVPAADEKAAIVLANSTSFGLGAALFTKDVERGERIAVEELHAGTCAINAHVRSDPRLPFGGIKASGYGRELGRDGIREFVNIKSIWIA